MLSALHTIFCRLSFCVVAGVVGVIPGGVRIIAGIVRVGVIGVIRIIRVIGIIRRIGAVAVRVWGRRGRGRRLRRFVAEEIIRPNGTAVIV